MKRRQAIQTGATLLGASAIGGINASAISNGEVYNSVLRDICSSHSAHKFLRYVKSNDARVDARVVLSKLPELKSGRESVEIEIHKSDDTYEASKAFSHAFSSLYHSSNLEDRWLLRLYMESYSGNFRRDIHNNVYFFAWGSGIRKYKPGDTIWEAQVEHHT